MVPPESLFGVSNALLVLIVSLVSFSLAGFILWQRVFRLVLLGRRENRLDQPIRRITKLYKRSFTSDGTFWTLKCPCVHAPTVHTSTIPCVRN